MSVKELPHNEHTFTLKFTGEKTGRVYEGTFTYKTPTNRTMIESKKMAARLSEGLPLDQETAFMINVFAELRYNLTNNPEWWVKADYGYELEDMDVVLEIYRACRKFENERFEKLWKEPAPAPAPSEPAKS